MSKKKIGIILIVIVVLGLGFIFCQQIFSDKYVPADDEIALHIQLDIEQDIGLLVFDYLADGHEYSGGVSNADRSLIKHNSDVIQVWNKQELNSSADTVELSIQFRLITEYVDPNYENVYPEEITAYIDTPVSFKAHYGEEYSITIIGDNGSGYTAVLN